MRKKACDLRVEYKSDVPYEEQDINSRAYICPDCKENSVPYGSYTCEKTIKEYNNNVDESLKELFEIIERGWTPKNVKLKTMSNVLKKFESKIEEMCADTTKLKFINEVKEHEGEMVIFLDEIVFLLPGIEEDEYDYYYRYASLKEGYHLMSCVGGWLPLKNRLDEKEYESVLNIFKLNYERITKIPDEVKEEIKQLLEKNESEKFQDLL